MENKAFESADSEYYTQEKRFLHPFIPDGPNVLMDVGCAAGSMGKSLLESNKAIEVIGVELFAAAAAEARKHYKTVHVGDLDVMELNYEGYFDVVVCGDVLEHLKDPGVVLKQIHRWLKDGGLLVCSVPNVRYWRIWRDLVVRGDWQYKEEGLMDHTHLRWFTTKSLRRLLTDSRFVIEQEGMKMATGPRQEFFHRWTFGIFREFLGFQILMSARKASESVSSRLESSGMRIEGTRV